MATRRIAWTGLKAVAWQGVGGLSTPSKMPCYGFNLSAMHCKTGAQLRKVPGSVCHKCYARRGNYRYTAIQSCMAKRLEAFDAPEFVANMSWLLNNVETSGFFRWFDSGDLQSVRMLKKIVAICNNTPQIRHWLPTKEYKIVLQFLKEGGIIPPNLNIRLSAYLINRQGPVALAKRHGLTVSEVRSSGFNCPASYQDNKCGNCRACWNKDIMTVSYKEH